jgi:hypothetical protein
MTAAESVSHLASSSSPEEWEVTAKTLFHNKRFLEASRCFERANSPREREVALAYYYREQASQTPYGRGTAESHRKLAFLKAANAFASSAQETILLSEMRAYYRIAAECYIQAAELKKAGEAYLLAKEHTLAAQTYRQGGLFDEAVDTVEKYKANIAAEEAEKICDVAKIHYFKENELE